MNFLADLPYVFMKASVLSKPKDLQYIYIYIYIYIWKYSNLYWIEKNEKNIYICEGVCHMLSLGNFSHFSRSNKDYCISIYIYIYCHQKASSENS